MAMILCTEAAARILTDLRERSGVPETFGVRVFADDADGERGVRIGFAPTPYAGDQVAEQHGELVFVAQEVAARLDGMQLDVDEEEQTLVLRPLGFN